LLNLVGNAIKFTERGAVGLCANLVESKDHTAEIKFTVSDTGIGMSPEEAKAIFEPFTQVDSSNTRKYGGAGLGLSITKKLVEAMGGEIGFVSKKGKGSTFWVNLPMSTVMPEHTPDLPEAGGGHVVCPILSGDVLLVEDNKLLQLLTKRQLQKIGFSPDVVEDGRSAVEAVQTRKYKIVLMDLQLPQLDGYQATRRIREIEKTSGRRTPIVATTASAGPDDVQNCLRVGMDDVLSKPLTTEALATALSKWSLKETD
jgi:two-component system, sensor histidine kinase and response regulator